jgi:hypothetical protein
MYRDGQGVAQDSAKAREWLEKAAAQGDAKAQYNLGLMYYHGQGVAKDLFKAREWYEQVAAQRENAENAEVVRKARQILEQIRQVR